MTKQFQELYDAADAAGREAVANMTPTPMIVGEETSLFSGVIDENKPTYYVSDGVCGFAWVNIKPGNCKFANWMKKQKLARPDSYYGGITVWVSQYNQSMERKAAYAGAFACVIANAGVAKSVYSDCRMD